MRRGEVWRVSGLARERVVLVVGNDAVTDLYTSAQTVEIAGPRARETLVTVRIDAPVQGVALVANVVPTLKKRFEELLGTVDAETMERVEIALRAVYDLI